MTLPSLAVTKIAKAIRLTDRREFAEVDPLQTTLYAPSYLHVFRPSGGNSERAEWIYTMGDPIYSPFDTAIQPTIDKRDLMNPQRGADRIRAWYRPNALIPWASVPGSGRVVVDRRNFPWMFNRHLLERQPEAFVGEFASPCVIRVGELRIMFLCVGVSDPFVTTAGHKGGQTQYMGPDDDRAHPWGYFVGDVMVGVNGIDWDIVDMGRPSDNPAIQTAGVYFEPRDEDKVLAEGRPEFQGLYGWTGFLDDDGWIKLTFAFSSATAQKSGLLRVHPNHLSSFWLWDTSKNEWEPLVSGRLPLWFIEDPSRGVIYSNIPRQIIRFDAIMPGRGYPKYLLIAEASGFENGGKGLNNAIQYAGTDSLGDPGKMIDFGQGHGVVDMPPGWGAKEGPDKSITTPFLADTPAGLRWLWASSVDLEGGKKGEGEYGGLYILEGVVP